MSVRIKVYDKDRIFQRQVGNPTSLVVTPRVHPLIGTAVMSVPLSHPAVPALRADGARVVFEDPDDPGITMSGPVHSAQIDSETASLKVAVWDDSWILGGILGWQVPGTSISSQGSAEYKTYTGRAETIVKNVVRENGVNRLGVPGLVVAPDQGRGNVVDGGASYRMHPIPDRIYPGIEMAGIGLRVRQVGTNLVFDVYEPRTYPQVLSVDGRTVKAATHTRTRPTASRVVIGGPGEAKERRYRQLVDTARENRYGFCGETFRDARDAKDDSEPENVAATNATMDARGRETLTETAAVNGLSITLAESSIFSYSTKGVLVGDRVTVNVFGTEVTDTVNEARLELIAPGYVQAEPIIGEQVDPAVRQAKMLAALKESQRKEERA